MGYKPKPINESLFVEIYKENKLSKSELQRMFDIGECRVNSLIKKYNLYRSPEITEQIRMESMKRRKQQLYGKNYKLIVDKVLNTKQQRYGNSSYNNREKCKQTKLNRYGNKYYCNINKIKQTKKEKYGDENYNNIEKIKQTQFNRHGKIGYNNREKCDKTFIKHFGTRHYQNVEKIKHTKLLKYGNENYNNREKFKQTNIKRYGSPNHMNSTKVDFVSKMYKTKEKNGTFKRNKTELNLLDIFNKTFNNVMYQVYEGGFSFDYKVNNILIELNGVFWHNYRPFENTEQDIQEYNNLYEKGSTYKKIAIKWRNNDVNKLNYCINNNKKYLIIYFGDTYNKLIIDENNSNIIYTNNFQEIINYLIEKFNCSTTIENR